MMSGELFEDPELEALDRRFRDELRAEAEEYERLAAKDLLRSRDLSAVALELLHRGDVVGLVVGDRPFLGTVTYAARGLLCLRTATQEVDVSLTGPLAIQVVERVRDGGQGRARGAGSFVARLREHEMTRGTVELWCPGLAVELRGVVAAVAVDHVVFDTSGGQRWFVARSAIAAVVRQRAADPRA